ncbi:hypothetical protein CDL12_06478 [Handroanthus impetiginosus]|uniref:PB1-like domain-containing protein n=1 Tax=Handroanthus impetiginosus TaxID=429701 RepID=A0A2G9HU52_9LAMI|nr:hypothetical protein CDL12_06478 [Handroanthus impetiginosus]
MVYVGGKVDHMNHCCQDEISLLEIIEMAQEIRIDMEGVTFYYNRLGSNDFSDITIMQTNSDALNLVNFIDKEGVAGIFVDHGNVLDPSNSFVVEESQTLLEIDEGLEYIGKNVDNLKEEDRGLEETVSMNEKGEVTIDGENTDEIMDENRDRDTNRAVGRNGKDAREQCIVDEKGLLDVGEGRLSDDEQSLGDDSSISEGSVDSENDASKDKELSYNVDLGGLRSKMLNLLAMLLDNML